MSNLLYTNEFIDLDLVADNDYIIVSDSLSSDVKINVNNNIKCNILLFSKTNSNINLNVVVNENANFNIDIISMNNQSSDNYKFDLVGDFATVDINLLSLAKNGKKDFLFNVNHLAKETKSSITNNGISFDEGINNFKVVGSIKSNMKNSDVRQITKGLILSPTGACLAEPILLIDYYDVKAYHGATIGKISDDDLFYLMSRGLTKEESFMLIINGLLAPFVSRISDEAIKEEVMKSYYSHF